METKKYDLEEMKRILVDTMMERQRSVTIQNVPFELLPVLSRDTPIKRLQQAEREAEKLIQILITN